MKSSASSKRRSKRSRGLRRRIVAAVAFAVLAVGVVVLWSWLANGRRSSPPVVSSIVATLASTPPPAWNAPDRSRLHAALAGAFAPALSGADRWSLAVLDARGMTLYDDRANRAATPASTQKLIVAATALDVLGARYRYTTILAGSGAIGADGTLDGNLWFVGSGDPSFRTGDLRGGVAALEALNLRHVRGAIAIDPSGMRGPEINPHWDPGDATEDYGAPTSADSLDGDTVEFDVTGTSPGEAADVRILPPSDAINSSGRILTSGEGGEDSVTIGGTQTPNSFTLSGRIPAGATEKYWLPVGGVPKYVGAVLARMLADRDIRADGGVTIAPAPLDTVALWQHRSAPLRAIETHMLYHSDNHYAEQLLRTIGGEQYGKADDADGIAAERRFLSARGIPTDGLRLNDASGLAVGNLVAAMTLARLLSDAELRGGDASLYMMLPQGGRQGTLKHYDFTTALGRVRAKSGHVSGVSALAGYVNTYKHGRVVFAFLIDGSPGDPDAAIVRAVNRLATF